MKTTTVYLLHFSDKLANHAQHYVGSTNDLDARLAAHASGAGAAIMAAVKRAGLTFICARTWAGDRQLERRIKRYAKATALCPICNPNHKAKGRKFQEA
jgi:predicted GIY-YIG superfamily endonuclease